MAYTTQAIVLKNIPSGEHDAVAIFYTRDFGKMRAYVQGVKKQEAKLRGHIEPLSVSMIQFILGAAGGERLIYAQMMRSWPVMYDDFDRWAAAHYMMELIDQHCLPGERDDVIWELILQNLVVLDQKVDLDIDASMREFEKYFIQALGYGDAHDIRVLGTSLARPFKTRYNEIINMIHL